MINAKEKRNYNLDIIRIFALFCVVSVHFFYRNNFYEEIIQGKALFLSVIIRSFFMICVPLFLILSGYLMNKKEPSKKYFFGIKKILIQYLICSTICFIFNMFYFKTQFSLYNLFFGMFNYSNASYAWYVEMYIGLYLLIPFLNIIYNNIKSRKDKQILLFILIIVTILPSIGTMFNFKMANILSTKIPSEKLLPTYWVNFYPITYYFVGCYLHEYKINISKLKNIIYIALSTLIFGIICIIVNYKNYFSWNLYQNYNSLFVFIISILVFILLLNIKPNNKKHKLLKHASDSVFCAYLLSSIFDITFYNLFFKNTLNWPDKIKYMIILVPIIFICTMISAMILLYIINFIKFKFKRGDVNA